jgi:DNA polymerase-3 subunit beta
MEIGFNSKFLLDMLSNLDSEEVRVGMSSPSRAGVITPNPQKEGEDILMLVMPVMLNN